ncbi:hypothetical protein Skr01_45890 [Sphaerisporangium krabiense]|nr:hypothetical protein Skr01_45890 [Sphaerisporangium krabiense]
METKIFAHLAEHSADALTEPGAALSGDGRAPRSPIEHDSPIRRDLPLTGQCLILADSAADVRSSP